METISGRHFPTQRRQMIICMEAWNYLQKTLDFPLSSEIIRQAQELMMEDEEDLLVVEYRKPPVFAGNHTFAPAGHIVRYMKGTIFRFHKTKIYDPIMAATNWFWSNYQYIPT